ncbi:hypothetical protein M9H77_06513 [Catharanthus roseus]|uniref:Uncharacterized protein n=1 Tax=Catharanthus roseus TaxID=4058 RepID=A0ACC0BSB3_CATRO|nr:hypothetical protein M9H77_06513 [Catharanthus roseus]
MAGVVKVKMANAEKKNFFKRMKTKKPLPICYYFNISGHVWRQCVERVKHLQQGKIITKPKIVVDVNSFKRTLVVKKIIKALVAYLSLNTSDWYLDRRMSIHDRVIERIQNGSEEVSKFCVVANLE